MATGTMHLHRAATGPLLLARCAGFLQGREVSHSALLGIAHRLTDPPTDPTTDPTYQPYLATVEDHGAVHAVVVRTPPHQLLLSYVAPDVLPAVVDCVVNDLRALGMSLPGVGGPVGVAEVFASHWARVHGLTARNHMAMREFALDRVVPTAPVPGALRRATVDDLDCVHAWVHAFIDESGLPSAERALASRDGISQRIAQGRFWLWEAGVGKTVCALAGSGGTPRVGRIGPVYTPPNARRRGYGSALTAALSQRLLDDGCAYVTLSTDLANPTSNKIYQALGYQPVGDSVIVVFEP